MKIKNIVSNQMMSKIVVTIGGALLCSMAALNAQFVAYNDQIRGANTHANATEYGVGANGLLKDINSGASTPVTLKILGNGNTTGTAAGAPNAGTPASTLFGPYIDFGNGATDSAIMVAGGATVYYEFSGLNPNKRYIFQATSVRAGGTSGEYPLRWTQVDLLDAAAYEDNHSAGVTTASVISSLNANQAAFNSGDNSVGEVVGWKNIMPTSGGTFSVRCSQYLGAIPSGGTAGGSYGYAFMAIRLEEVDTVPAPVLILNDPQSQTVPEFGKAVFTAKAQGNPMPTYQWFKNGNAIANETNTTLTLPEVVYGDGGSTYYVVAYNTASGTDYSATSAVATLTITPDTVAPVLMDVYTGNPTNVLVVFSEKLDATSATVTGNYVLTGPSGNITISSAVLDVSGSYVVLTVPALSQGAQYSMRVSNVKDRSNARNTIVANSMVLFTLTSYISVNVGNPAIPGTSLNVSGGFNMTAAGSGISGTSDQFSFNYIQKTGDFDVKVRIAGIDFSSIWAKAGLMARDNLNGYSTFAAAMATPTVAGVFFQSRTTSGGASAMGAPYPVNYPYTYLRLKRAGNTFTGYSSMDGQNWYEIGSAVIAMQSSIYVGYAVSSASATESVTAQFRDLGDVTGGAVVAPNLRREPLGPTTRRGGLVITEIMYNPRELPGTNNSLEFVEIFNSNPFFEDIGGFSLGGDIDFTFPSNLRMPAGAIYVVAKSPDMLKSHYGLTTNVYGPFTGSLPNDIGLVLLKNRAGGVMLETEYSAKQPWPVAADGTGHSLILARPSYGPNDARAWDASSYLDGSPGKVDPLVVDRASVVVINEFLANSALPQEDYIELFNTSSATVDLSGAWLTDKRSIMFDSAITNKYRIPDGTTISARGYKVFYQHELGFALAADGESIVLVNSNLNAVLDMVPFEGQMENRSSGRYPNGSPGFSMLASLTPGAANTGIFTHDVVINELMYNPISDDNDDEYLELYNKGTNVISLAGWKLVAGIEFDFPANASIQPGGYCVVAKQATNLFAKYSQLNSTNTVGDYKGSLANGGERVAIAMPELVVVQIAGSYSTNTNYIVIDEVTYRDGGRWGTWADRGGSSLELIDPRSDNRLAANWADSDETGKSEWVTLSKTETLDNSYQRDSAGNLMDEVQVMTLGQAEILMDDVMVMPGTNGANRVLNPSFATGVNGWLIQGNHVASRVEPASDANPSQCMRIVASAGGDNGANRVECDLSAALTVNTLATIGGKFRWLRGHPGILMRTHGGGIELSEMLPVPKNLGTPGLPNSRAVSNAGPAIWDVVHSPILPAANQPVVVTARVHDPDGVASLQLRWRVDTSGSSFNNIAMVDNGTGGDAVAGDGIYSATISGQASNTAVAFYLVGTDGAAPPVASSFPAIPSGHECMIRFGDPIPPGNLGVYRMWMSLANYNIWNSREKLSNEAMDGTFVYGNYRVIYNGSARYRGSPFTRSPASPYAVGANFVWSLPADESFLGSDELNIDSLEPTGRDATGLRELTAFSVAEQLNLPFSYQRFIHPVINGTVLPSPVHTDSQQPNGDYVEMWFYNDSEGDLFKIDDWFEYNDTPGMQGNKCASLENFTTTTPQGVVVKKQGRYRWNWEKKFNKGLNDDYGAIFDAVDALNAPDSMYYKKVESTLEIEEWLTTFALRHVIGDWDGYGYRRGKNQFVYHPKGKKTWMLLWDLDFSFGCSGGESPTSNLFEISQDGANGQNHMPEIARLYNNNYFRRAYMRALQIIADGPLVDSAFYPKLDARYNSLLANGVSGLVSPHVGSGAQSISISTWIQQRRAHIYSQISSYTNVAFNATGTNLLTANNRLTFTGTAPLRVKYFTVNGIQYPVTWTSPSAWALTFNVASATNTYEFQAYDVNGNAIAGMNKTSTVIYEGDIPDPVGTVMFSEIMYNPAVTNTEYVEIFNSSTNFTFDLSYWRVNGLGYTFPLGASIAPRGYLVLVKSIDAFKKAYPSSDSKVFAAYDGALDRDGETLSLIKPPPIGDDSGADIVVDRVRYEPASPWASGANGMGASLQLADDNRDNSRVINWGDASDWKFVSITASNSTVGNNTNLMILPGTAGDVYIDDLVIVEGKEAGVGENLVVNGGFEQPLTGAWNVGTNLTNSYISTDIKHTGNASLRIVATRSGTALTTSINQGIISKTNTWYTMSFWYLPSTNMTSLNIRLTSPIRATPFLLWNTVYATPGFSNTTTATLPELPPVWLNEVLAENTSGASDNAGDKEPWIELYNSGSNAVSLNGWYLSDNYSELKRWAFPADATINPGQFITVWMDGEPNESVAGQLHAGFRLAAGSGNIALSMPVDGDVKLLDYLNYTTLAPDQSYGNYPDGQPFYRQKMAEATLGGTNNPFGPLPAVSINEWMASNTKTLVETNGHTYEDWFELYNAGSTDVDLSGYFLTDDPTQQPNLYQIPAGYRIPAKGFLLVWADNSPERNSTNSPDLHANFQLSRSGEHIALIAPDGRIVSQVIFGVQTPDVSQGRYPDGASTIVNIMTNATPRQPNQADIVINNTEPSLAHISDQVLFIGQTLTITALATDTDVPAQTLTYELLPGAPVGASLDASGQLTWTPTAAQAPSTNTIRIRVTDSGTPAMTDAESFKVEVYALPRFEGGSARIVGNQVSLSFQTLPGKTYQLQYKNTVKDAWQNLGAAQTATGTSLTLTDNFQAQPNRFYRISVK